MFETKLLRSAVCLVMLLSILAVGAGRDKAEGGGEGVTTQEDTPVSITLVGSDPDGDTLTYRVVTGPSYGKLCGTAPKLTYTPNANFNGLDSFTFNVNDGKVDGVPVTVLIIVTAVNDPPEANCESVTIQEDTLALITLSGSDIDGDELTYSIVKGPSQGKLSGKAPNLTYTPNVNYSGSDSFTFKVNDGTVDSSTATVSIKLKPVNDPPTASYTGAVIREQAPIANDARVTTQEDKPVLITLTGSDADGDTLSYQIVKCPSNGDLSGKAPKLTYTPNPDFNGSDNFVFKVSDGTADSDAATVSITVKTANDPPIAKDDNATTQEDKPILKIDVLANDTDIDKDKLTTAAVIQGKSGWVTINADSTVSYDPKVNFYGSDSFNYTVSDGRGGTDTATVHVKVKAVNDAPKAENSSVTTREDGPVSITLAGSDIDGDSLSYSVVKGPSHGKLSGTAPKLKYTPKANFNGSDSFTFKVSDGTTGSATATVSITVTAVNDRPKANDDSVTILEDKPTAKIDVLANDTDVDDDSLKISTVTQGTNGSVSINADNTLSYAPKADFFGSDAFTYTICDDKGATDSAAVHVTVKAVNDAPKLTSKPVTKATVGALYSYDVDASDPDVGDTLTYSLTVKPAGMSIDAATGLIEWTPSNAQVGANEVVVKVADNGSAPASDTQSFTVTVGMASTPAPTVPAVTPELTVESSNVVDQEGKKILLVDDKNSVVQASNDRWVETGPGLYTSYNFSNISIPVGTVIASVVVYIEHFEHEQFPDGKLQWLAGTGWPSEPMVWESINAPVNKGEPNEVVDLWDVTSFVDTPEKVNSFQLQVKNNDDIAGRKSLVDHVYAVVEWR